MQDLPESPEGVALYLLTLLLRGRNDIIARDVLDLYVQCYNAAIGYRRQPREEISILH